MKTALVILLMVLAGSAFAMSSWGPNAVERMANSVESQDDMDPADFENCNSGPAFSPPEQPAEREGSPGSYAPLWGNDILVSDQWNLTSQSVISMDYDMNNNIYVASIDKHADHDSLKIYKSTDNGLTWSLVYNLYNNTYNMEFDDFDIRVNHAVTDPDIYIILCDTNKTLAQKELFFFIYHQTSGILEVTQFDPATAAYQNVVDLSFDINSAATPYIWCGISRQTDATNYAWSYTRSSDGGANWTSGDHSTASIARDAYVAIADDYLYTITVYNSTTGNGRIRMYRRNLVTGGDWFYAAENVLATRNYISVASYRTTYPANHVMVFWQEGTGTSARIKYSSSTDGWQNSVLSQTWEMTGDFQAVRPYVRAGWLGGVATEMCGMATLVGSYDSLVVAYYTGSGWGSRVVPNDHDATGEISPQGTVISSGRAIVYRGYGSDNIWFDCFANTNSVEETPSATCFDALNIQGGEGNISVSFSLSAPANVDISVFDILGRKSGSIFSGSLSSGDHTYSWETPSSGRYFVTATTREGSQTKSVMIF